MRRRGSRLLVGLVAIGLLTAGLAGAYSYAQNYYQHRGFVTIPQLPRAGRGRLLRVNFYSPALRRRAYYLAYLPPGYSTARRYPVFYLLHGMPGRPQVWIDIANMDVRLDNQLSEGHLRPMILVFPDGRIGGSTYSDSEWANTQSGRYESYVLDVVSDVEHRFSTLRNRRERAIAGFSAGAYGAINIALHNLAVFGAVQVWSGYFTQTRSAVFAHATRSQLAYNSPIDYLATVRHQLRRDPLRVFMFVGRDDESSAQIRPMARALGAAGANVSYAIYAGGHDWQVWYPRLNQMLIQASQDFSGAAFPASTTARRTSALGTSPLRAHARPARRATRSRRRHSIRARRAGWPARPAFADTPARAARGPALSPAAPRYSGPPARSPSSRSSSPSRVPREHHPGALLAGLLLALLSAAAINLGFLLQHRGLVSSASPGRNPLVLLRSRSWVGGQAVGWLGFGAQIVAVALAPLSLVQAFAAGGLALSVPLAAGVFRHRVSRDQRLAVLVIAFSLASLPIGLASARGETRTNLIVISSVVAVVLAGAIATRRAALSRAVAAGVFYGVADAAIKADSLALSAHGAGGLLSGWTLLAVLATFAGFLAFQAALRVGNAVSAISAMTAVTALAALAFGLAAFGESLGVGAPVVFVHSIAIALVLSCVPLLARAQQEIADAEVEPTRDRPRALRAALAIASAIGFGVMLVLSVVSAFGLLYALRSARVLAIGSPVPDSLPLLQLAGFDSQPLTLVVAAWLAAGMVLGVISMRIAPLPRAIAAAALGLVLLPLASDAAFALARNLRFAHVLWHRAPGAGPWIEAALLAAGAVLPDLLIRVRTTVSARLLTARVGVSSRTA